MPKVVATNGALVTTKRASTSSIKSQREILATKKDPKAFEQPPRMTRNRRSRDMTKYCHFHEDHGYETNQCQELRHQIEEAIKSGQLAHLVKGIKNGKAKAFDTQLVIIRVRISGRQVKRVYMDSGRSCKVIYEHCFLKLNPSIRSLKVDFKTSLVGFSGEHSWPLGEVPLEVYVEESPYTRTESMNFVIVSISAVLLAKREKRHVPIYFIGRVLQGAEFNYPELEKLILALVHAARRLQKYFQDDPIRVLTDKPIKQILVRPVKSGRIAKWANELGEHDIVFKGRNSVKGQILADFLAETPSIEEKDIETKKPETTNEALNSRSTWKLYTGGASSFDGYGMSLTLVSPERKKYKYTLRFKFETTNNEA
nr:putative ribonuclease H-like domain-containing protein [Tanacetum cinerariifolium]